MVIGSYRNYSVWNLQNVVQICLQCKYKAYFVMGDEILFPWLVFYRFSNQLVYNQCGTGAGVPRSGYCWGGVVLVPCVGVCWRLYMESSGGRLAQLHSPGGAEVYRIPPWLCGLVS